MKKLLLVFAVLFASISSSFAYQSYTLNSSGSYAGTQVSINSYCNYVGFQTYFTATNSSAVAYESGGQGTLVGETSYYDHAGSSTYSNTVVGYRYWASIQIYMYAPTGSYATLFWD